MNLIPRWDVGCPGRNGANKIAESAQPGSNSGCRLKDLSYYDFPKDQVAFCLLAVSQNTQIEEEVRVYSFESLVAELGGSLGLFLGFSFMTIWDGFKSFVIWTINLKTSQECKSALPSQY